MVGGICTYDTLGGVLSRYTGYVHVRYAHHIPCYARVVHVCTCGILVYAPSVLPLYTGVYTLCIPYIQPIYPICMVRVYWVGNVEGGLVHVSLVLLCYLIGAVVSLVATVTIGK